MDLYEMFSFAKLFSQVIQGQMQLSDSELEAASKVLKELGDNNPNWTDEQKRYYKNMVDFTKEYTKGQRNG